jgi:16S rRNA (adenine1518-N6/adenine1519-N6)-dimethyltransferase
MEKHRAKKSLGQNFLTQPKIAMDMVHAGDITADDIVIEIGPGKGMLTEKLIMFAAKVVAIEKDSELVNILKEKFGEEIKKGKLEILEEDARNFDPEVMGFYDLPYKVIANIPYYITGEIIRKFLEAKCQPEQVIFMVQKEVAERIVARDGKESILSISVKVYGEPKIVKKVSAGSFYPKPNVDSAILSIENISKDFFIDISEKTFFEIMKKAFSQKRKQLGGTLKDIFGENTEKILKECDIDPKRRPETLTKGEWKKLVLLASSNIFHKTK